MDLSAGAWFMVALRRSRPDHDDLRCKSLEQALDWLLDGIAIIRGDGSLVYANKSFWEIAAGQSDFRIARGRIKFKSAKSNRRLSELINSTSWPASPSTIAVPTSKRPGVGSLLLSLSPISAGRRTKTGAVAMIFARQLKHSRMAAGRLLSQTCRLTAAEADLAQALQNGHSLVDWARRRKVSSNTVYTQLRVLKKKIGAHRLPELIRKLNDMELPVRNLKADAAAT